jgi:hypothetical protein
MPSSHRRYAGWTIERIRADARMVGPATAALCGLILEQRPHPEQGFRTCQGVVRPGNPRRTLRTPLHDDHFPAPWHEIIGDPTYADAILGQRGSRPGRHHSVPVGDIIQESRAASSRYTRATSAESADVGRNAEADFHGQKRSNDTHASTTGSDARLYRKGKG